MANIFEELFPGKVITNFDGEFIFDENGKEVGRFNITNPDTGDGCIFNEKSKIIAIFDGKYFFTPDYKKNIGEYDGKYILDTNLKEIATYDGTLDGGYIQYTKNFDPHNKDQKGNSSTNYRDSSATLDARKNALDLQDSARKCYLHLMQNPKYSNRLRKHINEVNMSDRTK